MPIPSSLETTSDSTEPLLQFPDVLEPQHSRPRQRPGLLEAKAKDRRCQGHGQQILSWRMRTVLKDSIPGFTYHFVILIDNCTCFVIVMLVIKVKCSYQSCFL